MNISVLALLMVTFLQREAPAQDFTLPLTKDSFKSTLDASSIGVHALWPFLDMKRCL